MRFLLKHINSDQCKLIYDLPLINVNRCWILKFLMKLFENITENLGWSAESLVTEISARTALSGMLKNII